MRLDGARPISHCQPIGWHLEAAQQRVDQELARGHQVEAALAQRPTQNHTLDRPDDQEGEVIRIDIWSELSGPLAFAGANNPTTSVGRPGRNEGRARAPSNGSARPGEAVIDSDPSRGVDRSGEFMSPDPVRSIERDHRQVLIIDSPYYDTKGRPRRFRRDARAQTLRAARARGDAPSGACCSNRVTVSRCRGANVWRLLRRLVSDLGVSQAHGRNPV
jgi:hypothetical protein